MMLKPGDIVKRQGADETGVVLSVGGDAALVAWAGDIDSAIRSGTRDNPVIQSIRWFRMTVAEHHQIAELVRV